MNKEEKSKNVSQEELTPIINERQYSVLQNISRAVKCDLGKGRATIKRSTSYRRLGLEVTQDKLRS